MKYLLSQRRHYKRFLIALLTLAMLGVAEGATLRGRQASAKSWSRHFAIMPVATESLRPAEQGFLESAADRSRREMRLAEMALSNASNADVRALAMQLSADHRRITRIARA
jgi:predicted outer membrane protein